MPYIGQSLTEGTRREYNYTATSGQTVFPAIYTVGAVDVHQNGILLPPSDYTATDGTTVVFATGCAVNDEVVIHCHNTFSVADTVSASAGGTFSGAVVANDGLTINNDAATVLTVDRATSAGTLVDFKKDGTTVGSIGTIGGDLFISNSDTGLRYRGVEDNIIPCDGSGGSRDNAVSLGGSPYRFKDLYLSGGVYLGGTGAANKLDDYEEGTWDSTPSTSTSSLAPLSGWAVSQQGYYTKIGRLVVCQYYFEWSNTNTSTSSLNLILPFAAKSSNHWAGNGTEVSSVSFPSGVSYVTVRPENAGIHASFKGCGTGHMRSDMLFRDFGAFNNGYALGSFSYFTDD